ncbi:IS30 family transposase [Aquisalimonas sp. 2447]|uniref:IS30 family transposase n=1 Tax=Aquisalimonas sp. 2447 TaxID=2740807 RepID=UPI00143235DF|nr:IS30 family transposase [Aquisalimonas sp. 2447]QIT54514.1 IS30 family transposase [Aquisalimonas sp. 2447]QIT55238.1 IS30 family transposase [Aquisalimonas sp. 2447]QIT57019.1 IS30 family transposase [Aquisalimonas sp. 2447]
MNTGYRHLSSEERAVIFCEHQRGMSIRETAHRIGRCPATVSRELRRGHSPATGAYCPTHASQAYRARRSRCGRGQKLVAGTWLHAWVRDRLIHRAWSPEQIAGRLKAMDPDDPDKYVSHETIYAAIYAHPKGTLRKAMIDALRRAKGQRGQRRTTPAGGSMVPESLRIRHRPEEIEQRLMPGHWEGDFIKGAYNRSAVGTVVERKTRFVVLSKMNATTAEAALEGFSRQMGYLPAILRQSMTYDRGSEMACHAELARRLRLDIWFADPHAPWQRGSNENTNGLLRQFLPKGADLSEASQTQLNDIARLLNQRPRKTLGWKTPEEAMNEELHAFSKSVALDS